jgi:hypothetical protein
MRQQRALMRINLVREISANTASTLLLQFGATGLARRAASKSKGSFK